MDYRIVQILDDLLGPGKSLSNGEHYYFCPFCHHHNPKFAVNVIKGKWQCWKCNKRGSSLLYLIRKLGASRTQIIGLSTLLNEMIPESITVDSTIVTLPPEYIPLWQPSETYKSKLAREYLKSRHVSINDIVRYQIGYCETGKYYNRIIVPSYDLKNTLNFFIGRDFTSNLTLSYLTPSVSKNIVALENQINWNYPIILVEGMFDAMTTKRNAIPLLGKTLSDKLQTEIIRMGVEDIYLALDDDALKQTIRIAEHYMREGINVWVVDINGKDPSVIGSDKMFTLMKSATKLNFTSLLQLKMRLIK